MTKEQKFQQELIDKSTTAKKECGYNPTRFIQMLASRGGVQTAKDLISKRKISDGFTTLQMAGRLDLTMEASVVSPEYVELFSDDEVNYCYELLCECNYYGK